MDSCYVSRLGWKLESERESDRLLNFADKTFMLFGDAKAVVGELAKHLAGNAGG